MTKRYLMTVAISLLATAAAADPALWSVDQGGNDHLYERISGPVSWNEAATAAREADRPDGYGIGYLATVTSGAEQAFLATNFPTNAQCVSFGAGPCLWIAANDIATEGTFIWSGGAETGERLSYTNWYSGEPNDFNQAEDCTIFGWSGTSSWNDIPCESTHDYLLEHDPLRACADPVGSTAITAADALYVLKTAVGLKPCMFCTCDVDGNGAIGASDASRALRKSVALDVALQCPGCNFE